MANSCWSASGHLSAYDSQANRRDNQIGDKQGQLISNETREEVEWLTGVDGKLIAYQL